LPQGGILEHSLVFELTFSALLTEAIWRLVTLQIDPAFDADLMKAGA
jgi:hypothetical protein